MVCTPKALYSIAQGQHAAACATLGDVGETQMTNTRQDANDLHAPQSANVNRAHAHTSQGGARYRVLTLGY